MFHQYWVRTGQNRSEQVRTRASGQTKLTRFRWRDTGTREVLLRQVRGRAQEHQRTVGTQVSRKQEVDSDQSIKLQNKTGSN